MDFKKPEINTLQYFRLSDIKKYFKLGDELYDYINASDISYGYDNQDTIILNKYFQDILRDGYDDDDLNIKNCVDFLKNNKDVDILI